ncbi:helix-turn-helix domain-containing protein [Actinokineospora soli]|uniref:Helix-turn-helix domain-containing protein n=1 Tax=Actinokineospora soli TaxID=1048753 RepID=A0ABW2TFP8_9PSEU
MGASLKRMRMEAEVSREEAAALLGCTPVTVGNVEQGRTKIGQADLAALLQLYRVPEDQAADLLEVNRAARRSLRRVSGGSHIQPHQRRAADLIDSAHGMRYYSPDLFPGVLQHPAYARAIMAPTGHVSDVLEARLQFRLGLAKVLTRDEPLRLSVVVGEAALRKNIGGPSTMRSQLAHVAKLCREQPNITIQVLPFSAREHYFMGATVTVYSFGPRVPDIASVDTTIGEQFFDRDVSVAEAIGKFDDVRIKALDPLTSVDMLEELSSC